MTSGGVANEQNVAIGRCPAELILVSGESTLSDKDKKFLGNATSNKAAVDGVCNEASSYGSKYGTDSIFNMYGTYGSEYSSQSAYDKYTSTPPVLFCAATNTEFNRISKSTTLGLSIDPDLLCRVLEANGY